MVEYLFLIFAIICIGGQFSLSKLYQVKVGNGAITSFSFSLIERVIIFVIILLIWNGATKAPISIDKSDFIKK